MMPIKGTDPKKAMEMAAEFDKRQLAAAAKAAEQLKASQLEAQQKAAAKQPAAKPAGGIFGSVANSVANQAQKAAEQLKASQQAAQQKAAAQAAVSGVQKAVGSLGFGARGTPPGMISGPGNVNQAGASKPTTTAPSMGTKPGTTDVRPPMPSGPIQTQTLAPGATAPAPGPNPMLQMKKGGRVKAKAKAKSSYSSGGKVSSASKRGDGCAQRGKTKGRMI